MTIYDVIYEELCDRVESGELALEDAEVINDLAYDRYAYEASKEEADRFEKIGRYEQRGRRSLAVEIPNMLGSSFSLRGTTGRPKGDAETVRRKHIRKAFNDYTTDPDELREKAKRNAKKSVSENPDRKFSDEFRKEYKKVLQNDRDATKRLYNSYSPWNTKRLKGDEDMNDLAREMKRDLRREATNPKTLSKRVKAAHKGIEF